MLDFLPQNLKNALTWINVNDLYEIRLRVGKPTTVNFGGEYRYLGAYGLTERKENAYVCTLEEIEECVFQAGNCSVYSVEEQIKRGFITSINGERLGLSGECVQSGGQLVAIRNFTSLCIRVPHEVIGCAEELYQYCMSDRVRSVLLMSSPGLGKTTILRDLTRILSEKTKKNMLICDERGEISIGKIGESCDIVRFCDKEICFEAGIRAMRPDIIVTDELSLRDCAALSKAIAAGLYVVASSHFSQMQFVGEAFLNLFERFVLLDERKIGRIKGIYDREGRQLYG